MPALFTRKTKLFASGQIYGVGISLEAGDRKTMELMRAFLPPVWQDRESAEDDVTFRLVTEPDGALQLLVDGEELMVDERDRVLEVFDRQLRNHVARSAPDHVFVHAGVVASGEHAIVIPGASFSGKTTLVAALVRAGASYYSDEYAVFDADGSVLPFQKPLAMRLTEGDARQTPHHVGELGGMSGTRPVRAGLVVLAQYRPGAEWDPVRLTPADAVIEVFGHTYLGLDRPAQSLSVLKMALAKSVTLKGDRGNADVLAPQLLSLLPD